MTAGKLRIILRWVHLIVGLVLLCYVYSPFSKYPAFCLFVKFIAVPVVVLSGIWVWKFVPINKFLRIK